MVLIPELDSVFVLDLIETLTDTTGGDSLALDSLFESLFFELLNSLYLGIDGIIEISDVTDSTILGGFYTTMLKPAFYFPPHMVSINNGEFNFTEVTFPNLSIKPQPVIPELMTIYPAYPNPFNPSTTIRFSVLNRKRPLSLHIYDIEGRLIERLFNGYVMPGVQEVRWNARRHPSGIYFAMFRSGESIRTSKLILMK